MKKEWDTYFILRLFFYAIDSQSGLIKRLGKFAVDLQVQNRSQQMSDQALVIGSPIINVYCNFLV